MTMIPELNRRHLIGVSTLALMLAGLGLVANKDFGPRRISALPEAQLEQNVNEAQPSLFSALRRLPENVYGSAANMAPEADSTTQSAVSPSSESKFWSDREWQAASKAVADYRSSQKSRTGKSQGALIWQPPEEIAGRSR